MLERVIIGAGALIGVLAAFGFYHAVEHLPLPSLIYAIVDLFGVTAGSIVVGFFSAQVAIGILVLLVIRILPPPGQSADP